jgi:hypothetical protein
MDLLSRLKSLYDGLPEVACTGCGTCCVSPTVTLAEFIYHMHFSLQALTHDELEKKLLAEPELHPGHDGNLRCVYLDSSRCLVHPGRSGSCRIFGIPALAELDIPDLVQCANNIAVIKGDGTIPCIQRWIERLFDLNRELYPFDAEPYYIKGLNLECWLDVYFDDSLNFDLFADIRRVMREHIDISAFASAYRPKTGLREKIDKITVLSAMLGSATGAELEDLLRSIRDGYPFTGSYYYEEAGAYLDEIRKSEIRSR